MVLLDVRGPVVRLSPRLMVLGFLVLVAGALLASAGRGVQSAVILSGAALVCFGVLSRAAVGLRGRRPDLEPVLRDRPSDSARRRVGSGRGRGP